MVLIVTVGVFLNYRTVSMILKVQEIVTSTLFLKIRKYSFLHDQEIYMQLKHCYYLICVRYTKTKQISLIELSF